jgi:CheY-like chemotaxis protein
MVRLLLRAEIEGSGAPFVCHTIEISDTLVFLETDQAEPIGTRVTLRLSFPRLVQPFELEGKVVEHRGSGGPGEPTGMMVELAYRSDDERKLVAALLARTSAQVDTPDAASIRVLLVEDNDLICDMFAYGVRKFFRSRGGNVTIEVARDGEEAWKRLHAAPYDFAIVDVYLPVLNGDQLIARMRGDATLANIPVIAISVGGPRAREMSLAAGADLFLDKPIVLRDLFATLNRLTQSGAP